MDTVCFFKELSMIQIEDTVQALFDLRVKYGDPKEKLRKQKPRKSRLLSGTKGEENRIEL